MILSQSNYHVFDLELFDDVDDFIYCSFFQVLKGFTVFTSHDVEFDSMELLLLIEIEMTYKSLLQMEQS